MPSILANQDVTLNYGDKVMESRRDIEQALLDALGRGFVTCVINKYEDSGFTETMLSDAYGESCCGVPFSQLLQTVLKNSVGVLSDHSKRRIEVVDCSTLKKGDSYAFLAQLSEMDDAIVVIENATRVPEGNLNTFDAKSYIENILIRSWKNEHISVGDLELDRNKFSVFIACPQEDSEKLASICRTCDFAWCESLDALLCQ